MSAKLYIVRYITARFSIHLQGEIASIRSKSDISFSFFSFSYCLVTLSHRTIEKEVLFLDDAFQEERIAALT